MYIKFNIYTLKNTKFKMSVIRFDIIEYCEIV